MKKLILPLLITIGLFSCTKKTNDVTCPSTTKNVKVYVSSPKNTSYTLTLDGTRIKTGTTSIFNVSYEGSDTFMNVNIDECVQHFTIVVMPTDDSLIGSVYEADPINSYVIDSAGYLIIYLTCYNK